MKRLVLIALLAAGPVPAQNAPAGAEAEAEGFSLMQEGAELLFRGLMEEMEPALEGLQDLGAQTAPLLEQLTAEMAAALAIVVSRIDDLSYYEMPEILENGDIIIRRRPDAPPYVAPPAPPADPVEL